MARAMPSAWSSLSMTQGPAMSASGAPPPITIPPPTGTARVGGLPSAGGRPVAFAGIDEAPEQRVGLDRLRFELGMELTGEEIRVIGDLDDLDEPAVRSLAGDPHAALLEIVHVPALDLVAVAVPLADLRATVGLVGGRRSEERRVGKEWRWQVE